MSDHGRTRRDWLRSGAGFFGALVEACQPAARHPRGEPPSTKAVIPAGREADVLALLGPLAKESFDGYKLAEAKVEDERIVYSFDGPHGRVRILLVALTATGAGIVHAYTRSFRLIAEGDAPPETQFAVAERVAAEVLEHDHGQLWVKAAEAPRRDGGT